MLTSFGGWAAAGRTTHPPTTTTSPTHCLQVSVVQERMQFLKSGLGISPARLRWCACMPFDDVLTWHRGCGAHTASLTCYLYRP